MKKLIIFILLINICFVAFGQDADSKQNILSAPVRVIKEIEKTFIKPKQLIKGKVNRGVDSAKTNTFIIDYDFQTGIYNRNNLKIKVHTPTAFKITNINRLAYNIDVNHSDSTLAETDLSGMPNGFFTFGIKLNTAIAKTDAQAANVTAQLNAPTNQTAIVGSDVMQKDNTETKSKETLNKNEEKVKSVLNDVATLNKIQVIVNEITALNNQIDTLNDGFEINTKAFKTEIEAIEFRVADSTDKEDKGTLKKNIEIKNGNFLKISDKFNLQLKELTSTKSQKDSLLKTYQKIKNDAFKKFEFDYEKFLVAFEKVKKSYNSSVKAVKYYQQVAEAADNPVLSLNTYDTQYRKAFKKIAIAIPTLRNNVENFKAHYTDLEIFYKHLKYNPQLDSLLDYGGQIKLYANAEAFKLIADNMNTYATQVNFEQLLTTTAQTIIFLSQEKAYNVTSYPIQASNDVLIFNLKINKKIKNTCDFLNNRNFTHSEFTYGGTRLDFSIGLAGSYFNATPVYELSTTAVKDSTSVIKINPKANNLTVPSLVLLTTMSYRKAGYVAFGGSAGLGVDVANGKIQLSNFFVGPSILFGKFERMMLTAGASIRNVGQLKSGYKVGGNVTTSDLNSYISDKYKIGTFIAITYHLTKKAKSNINQFIK
jgi:hypothetical protein